MNCYKFVNFEHTSNLSLAAKIITSAQSDIYFISKEGYQIGSHRCFLSLLSPYLSQMFSNISELTIANIHLPDFPAHSISRFLKVIYTSFTTQDDTPGKEIDSVINIANLLGIKATFQAKDTFNTTNTDLKMGKHIQDKHDDKGEIKVNNKETDFSENICNISKNEDGVFEVDIVNDADLSKSEDNWVEIYNNAKVADVSNREETNERAAITKDTNVGKNTLSDSCIIEEVNNAIDINKNAALSKDGNFNDDDENWLEIYNSSKITNLSEYEDAFEEVDVNKDAGESKTTLEVILKNKEACNGDKVTEDAELSESEDNWVDIYSNSKVDDLSEYELANLINNDYTDSYMNEVANKDSDESIYKDANEKADDSFDFDMSRNGGNVKELYGVEVIDSNEVIAEMDKKDIEENLKNIFVKFSKNCFQNFRFRKFY